MPDNDKQSPRGIPVSGEVQAEERKALDLNPQGRKPTKLKREIRITIFSILCVVFLAFVFGVVKRRRKDPDGCSSDRRNYEAGGYRARRGTNGNL